jgi:hypothetical protein
MAEEPEAVREVNLLKLGCFCQALAEAMGRAGLAAEQVWGVWGAAVTAECTRCGTVLEGQALMALAQAPGENPTPELRRLRLGDCVQPGCESYFYRLTFRRHPPLEWPAVLAEVESIQAAKERPRPGGVTAAEAAKVLLRLGVTRRAAIAVGALLVLLLAWHWRMGGRIPWLREPEQFRVTPDPDAAERLPPGALGR